MTNRKEKKWLISLLLTFSICFIPRMLIGIILKPYSVYDEGPALASAAYLAGKDWSGVTAISAYYGFGYYILFAPLFKLTKNPYMIYLVITEVNAFMQALYGVIAFRIMHKFIKIEKVSLTICVSCICSYLTTVRPIIYNEVPLVLLVWIVTYLICALVYYRGDIKRKNRYSIFLFLAIAYSLTIHTRAIIMLIALIAVVLIYWLIYREWLFSLKTIPFCIICVVLANYSVDLVQDLVWKAGERVSVANTSIDLGVSKLKLFDSTTWRGFFLVFIGQVSTINLFSGGLFLVSIYILMKYVIVNWKKIRDIDENRYYVTITLLFLLCCLGMVAGQAMSWMYAIYPSLLKNEVGAISGYKAFSYVRYMGAFIGPFILCAIILVCKKSDLLKKVDLMGIIVLHLFIFVLWYRYVFPLLEGNNYALEPYIPFCFRKQYEPINIEQYRVALPWTIFFVIIFIMSILCKQMKPYYLFVLGLLMFQTIYMAVYNDSCYGKDRSANAALCYEFIDELDEKCEIPKQIYANGIDVQRLQFFLNSYQIEPNLPEYIGEETVLIYQGKIAELEGIDLENARIVNLGKNTFYIFWQDDYIDVVNGMGYEVNS